MTHPESTIHATYGAERPTQYVALTEAQQRLLIDDTVGVMDEESIGPDAAVRLMLSRIEAGGNWNGLIGYATLLETQARVRALRRAKQQEKQKS